MKCLKCKSESNVANSRLQKRSNSVWRRRNCPVCGATWTTLEHSDYASAWRVSKDGHLLDFRQEILYISLYEALKHRKTPATDAAYVLQTILAKLLTHKTALLPRALISKTSYDILRRYDKPAAAVYKATHSH